MPLNLMKSRSDNPTINASSFVCTINCKHLEHQLHWDGKKKNTGCSKTEGGSEASRRQQSWPSAPGRRHSICDPVLTREPRSTIRARLCGKDRACRQEKEDHSGHSDINGLRIHKASISNAADQLSGTLFDQSVYHEKLDLPDITNPAYSVPSRSDNNKKKNSVSCSCLCCLPAPPPPHPDRIIPTGF